MRRVAMLLLIAACARPSITIVMNEQNNSGQDGTATLTDVDSANFFVTVAIKESNFGGTQFAHIHEGNCADVGRIVQGLPPISDAGVDNFSLDGGLIFFGEEIPGQIAAYEDNNHCINVHDPRDFTLYVSCGDIK